MSEKESVLKLVDRFHAEMDDITNEMLTTNVNMHPVKRATIEQWVTKIRTVQEAFKKSIPEDAVIIVREKRPEFTKDKIGR